MPGMNLKKLSLALLCCQNGCTPLIMRWAMTSQNAEERFDTSQTVLVGEIIKVFLSILILYNEGGSSVNVLRFTMRSEILQKPNDTMKLAIPAILYYIQNVCMQLASANLPAAVFQVSYQGKTLVVAFCSVVMLQKQLKLQQWAAIGASSHGP